MHVSKRRKGKNEEFPDDKKVNKKVYAHVHLPSYHVVDGGGDAVD
jgi:hypothetical protein